MLVTNAYDAFVQVKRSPSTEAFLGIIYVEPALRCCSRTGLRSRFALRCERIRLGLRGRGGDPDGLVVDGTIWLHASRRKPTAQSDTPAAR